MSLKVKNHILPLGYTQLEYLQSDGTQWINTGVIPDNTTGFKVRMAVPETVSDIFRFGCRQDSGATRFIIGTMNGGAYLGFGDTLAPSVTGSWAITQNTQFVAQLNYLNDRHAYINNAISSPYSIKDLSSVTFTYPLIMFGRNSSGTVTSSAQSIYSCEITRGTEVIRNFIPAKNSSNVLGFYDIITNTFLTNSGTGTFTAGPEVTPTGALKEVHELYKKNGDGVDYIGELYKSNGQGGVEHIFSAGYDRTTTGASPLTITDARTKQISWQIDGQSKQGLLPSGYTQLEYLETDGNSCINTNLMITGNESWECVFENAGSNILSSPVLGTLNGGSAFTNKNNFSITYTTAISPGAYAVYLDGNNGDSQHSWNGGLLTDHTKQTIRYTGLNIAPTINGVAMTQLTPTTLIAITPTVSVRLFGRATTAGNGTFAQSGVRIYSFKGDTWNFIPAKNSSNVLGMYDTVTGQFFTNAGTGTFTAGPVCPTPTSPVDVYGVGDKTENLTSYILNATATGNGTSGTIISSPELNVNWEENTQYTFSLDCSASGVTFSSAGNLIFFCVRYTDGTSTYQGITADNYQQSRISFTTSANKTVDTISQINKHARWTDGTITIGNLSIVKGTTAPTSYIPYGYKVPILQVQNCGAVDLGTMDISKTAYGCSFEKSDMAQTETNAYITGYTLGRGDKTFRIVPVVSTVYVGIQDERFAGMTIEQIKELLSGKYLYYQRTADDTWTPPTINNLYLPDPLQKVGNYTDSIESDGTLTRGVCQLTLTGTENWSWNGANWFYLLTTVNIGSDESSELATHFKYSASTAEWGYFKLATNKYIYLFDSDGAKWGGDVTAMKSWLATQYAAGTPCCVVYPLATPTTSTVTVPQLSTVKGTNYISAETQVKPSNMSVTYRKRTK